MKRIPTHLTISWIRAAYQSGLTPRTLIEEIIERAKRTAEKHIWIVPPSLEFAEPFLEQLSRRTMELPLWGIPFSIKDNIDLAGTVTTAACRDFAYLPEKSAFVIQRLLDAGAIPVGKANLDQFATGVVGTRSPYGEVHNAYQPELISGGSSSGSAVSVACGMAAFSIVTDTGGSGRIPAALNGLYAYKPAPGHWSTGGIVPACASIDCPGVFANTLEDVLTINRLVQGSDPDCEWSEPSEERPGEGLQTIYLPEEEISFFGAAPEIYREKWNRVIQRTEKIGLSTKKIDIGPLHEASDILFGGAYIAERWTGLGNFLEEYEDSLFPVTRQIMRTAHRPEHTAVAYFAQLHVLRRCRSWIWNLLEDAVLVLPTTAGTYTRAVVRTEPYATNSRMGLYTSHCNLLSLSAIQVPEQPGDEQYPFGFCIYGRADQETLVAQAAELLSNVNRKETIDGSDDNGNEIRKGILHL